MPVNMVGDDGGQPCRPVILWRTARCKAVRTSPEKIGRDRLFRCSETGCHGKAIRWSTGVGGIDGRPASEADMPVKVSMWYVFQDLYWASIPPRELHWHYCCY